jgi:hypothetical protein
LFEGNHLLISERTLFDNMQKSCKQILSVLMTSLAQEGGHLYRLWKAKALKLTPVELHVLLIPHLSRYFELNLMILCQSFVFYLLGRIWTSLTFFLQLQ